MRLLTIVSLISMSVAAGAQTCEGAYAEYLRRGGYQRAVKEMDRLQNEMAAKGLAARFGDEYARRLLALASASAEDVRRGLEALYPPSDPARESVEVRVDGPGSYRVIRRAWSDGYLGLIGKGFRTYGDAEVQVSGLFVEVTQKTGNLAYHHLYMTNGTLVDRQLIYDDGETHEFSLRVPMEFAEFKSACGN